MTTSNYKPSMVPRLEDDKHGKRIKVSREYVLGLTNQLKETDFEVLNREKCGEAICPALYWFNDTPETRRILGVQS